MQGLRMNIGRMSSVGMPAAVLLEAVCAVTPVETVKTRVPDIKLPSISHVHLSILHTCVFLLKIPEMSIQVLDQC